LTAFVTALRAALPAGRAISNCVMDFANPAAYPSAGYDLPALAAQVSRVILMAYDEHGPWENRPGPVGALSWQRQGLRAVLRSVPAAELDLGVAGYGYAWRAHANVQLSDAQALGLSDPIALSG
jgi:spore germination protein